MMVAPARTLLVSRVVACAVAGVVACSHAGHVLAQSRNAFDDMQPGLADGAYLGVILPINMGFSILPPVAGAPADPSGFDITARELLLWDHPLAALRVSDVMLGTMVLGALTAPFIGEGSADGRELAAFLVALQTAAGVGFLTNVTKHLAGRQRPYAWEAQLDEAYESFFSGHASMTFAAATLLTIYTYEFEWLADDTRWVLPASAYAMAAFTAYVRVAGDAHWMTDVLVGALVGTGTAYLTFALRTD